jgi:hypothetical protein
VRRDIPATMAAALLALVAVDALAQKLPAPSRTVYKCEVSGKVVYSDDPCVGAQKLDVEPTRGVDKSAGPRRRGADVQREHHREAVAEAIRPVTGMDAKQLDKAGRRMKLQPEAQRECRWLDSAIPAHESKERLARMQEREAAQRELHSLRVRFRELRC